MAKRYNLDQKGLLRIRDVTETDNGTRYKCTVRPCVGCDPDSIFIILLFDPEEGKKKLPNYKCNNKVQRRYKKSIVEMVVTNRCYCDLSVFSLH